MNNFFILNLILLISLSRFILISNHYLNLLLAIEFIIITLLIIVRISNHTFRKEINIIFLFLSIIIIEGIFGLSLLLLSTQFYGKDLLLIIK